MLKKLIHLFVVFKKHTSFESYCLFYKNHCCFREKEKAEIKDRKVLEVLQLKDDKIEELQTLLTLRSRELGEIASV